MLNDSISQVGKLREGGATCGRRLSSGPWQWGGDEMLILWSGLSGLTYRNTPQDIKFPTYRKQHVGRKRLDWGSLAGVQGIF